MAKISPLSLVRNPETEASAPSIETLRERVQDCVADALCVVEGQAALSMVSYRDAECELRAALFGVGRALVVLFLGLREQRIMAEHRARHAGRYQGLERAFRVAPAIARNFTTWFGVVRYYRTYLRECGPGERHGFHPLDVSLGLNQDRFSWNVLMVAVRLATKMAFAEAKVTLDSFVPGAPSTEVIEKALLGLGKHTADFVEQAAAPEGDGDVLVVLFDGKGAPTADELTVLERYLASIAGVTRA